MTASRYATASCRSAPASLSLPAGTRTPPLRKNQAGDPSFGKRPLWVWPSRLRSTSRPQPFAEHALAPLRSGSLRSPPLQGANTEQPPEQMKPHRKKRNNYLITLERPIGSAVSCLLIALVRNRNFFARWEHSPAVWRQCWKLHCIEFLNPFQKRPTDAVPAVQHLSCRRENNRAT